MSALKDRLRTDLTASIKDRDTLRSSTLRMLLSAITNAEVAGKEARELSDDDVIGVLSTEAKIAGDSTTIAANREVTQRRNFAKGFTRNFSVFLDDEWPRLVRQMQYVCDLPEPQSSGH